MKIIAKTDRSFKTALQRIVTRSNVRVASVEATVKSILKGVERGGDRAVARYTKNSTGSRSNPRRSG